MRSYLVCAPALAFATAAPAVVAAETRPNLLLILTDDPGWATLGCYGGKTVSTPHLDRLAADGHYMGLNPHAPKHYGFDYAPPVLSFVRSFLMYRPVRNFQSVSVIVSGMIAHCAVGSAKTLLPST